MRTNRNRLSVVLIPVVALLAACSDAPTNVAAPAKGGVLRATTTTSSGTPTGKTVVVFKDTSAIPAGALDLISSLGGTVTTRWDNIGVVFVTGLSTTALASLSASGLVQSVGNDRILNWLPNVRTGGAVEGDVTALPQNNPANASYFKDGTQWNMRIIGADRVWAAGKQGAPTTRVAIVDTGIDYGHRELRTLVDLAASRSFANLIVGVDDSTELNAPIEPQLPGDSAFMDNHFHGTHVASTVASNNISVASIAPDVTLIAVKVLSMTGSGSFESVANGIRYASTTAKADVINMSLGAEIDANEDGAQALLDLMSRVIKDAEKHGTIVISAAGNSSLNLDVGSIVATPCEESTICVSATGPLLQQNFDQPAYYTNYGITAIEVAAPGGNADPNNSSGYVNQDLIIGACSRRATEQTLNVCHVNTDGVVYFYAYAAGTSMATPHVSAEAAMVKSYNPTLSVSGIRTKILGNADDIGAKGRDVYSNYGRINVARALGLK